MNANEKVGNGPRGQGIVQGRYPQDATAGRNLLRRQLTIYSSVNEFSDHHWKQIAFQLTPGLWRFTFYDTPGVLGLPHYSSAWFALGEDVQYLNDLPNRLDGREAAEQLTWNMTFRECWVDGSCKVFFLVPPHGIVGAILLSGVDEV